MTASAVGILGTGYDDDDDDDDDDEDNEVEVEFVKDEGRVEGPVVTGSRVTSGGSGLDDTEESERTEGRDSSSEKENSLPSGVRVMRSKKSSSSRLANGNGSKKFLRRFLVIRDRVWTR